ncbi:MAG: TIR domain-containing protein [Oscillospiraceae bacterium]|nr:TIR domain-containing protein [Oscillospiraceae bacterium]
MSAPKHYKAFISYRHLPLDLKVAKKLHRTIEHYVIPRYLRKDGNKRIGYVFRDQDELPISSDLSGSIRTALDNSEFLIVICSPETSKSVWVLEEITYFLKTHDRDHVLAVLISGDPHESFPEMLNEPVTDDDGTVRNIEPLAANIVADSDAKRNRLFSTEVLRILAALIGCAYDELYRREQRYRIRRLAAAFTAVFVIAASFIGLLLNRNAEINNNYEKALRNQSEYLSAESLRLLETDDRFSAMRLALAGLPSESEPDRPVVSKAFYALEKSSLAYYTPSRRAMYPSASLVLSSQIDSMTVSENGKLLYAETEDGLLSVWDTEAKKCIFSLLPKGNNYIVYGTDSGYFKEYRILRSKDRILLLYSNALICVDSASGGIIWRLELDQLPEITSIVYSLDSIHVSESEDEVLLRAWENFYVVSTQTGGLIRSLQELKMSAYGCDLIEFQGDEYIFSSDSSGITVFDSVTGGTISQFPFERETYGSQPSFVYSGDGVLYFCSQRKETGNYSLSDYIKTVYAFDVISEKLLWKWETAPETDYGASMTLLIDYNGRRILAYASGNLIALIDTADGSTIDMQVIGSGFTSMIDSSEKGAILGFTYDGESWTYGLREDGIRDFIIVPYLNTQVRSAEIGNGGYWVLPPYSQTIIRYEFLDGDPSWRYFVSDEEKKEIDFMDYTLYLTQDERAPVFGKRMYGNRRAVCILRGEDEDSLNCVAIPRTLEDSETKDILFTGCTEDRAYYLWTGYSAYELAGVDLNSGETQTVSSDVIGLDLSFFCADQDSLYALLKEYSGESVSFFAVSLSPDLQVKEKVLISGSGDTEISELSCIGSGRLMAYSPERTYIIDLSRKKVSEALQAVHEAVSEILELGNHLQHRVIWSEKQKSYIFDPDDIMIRIIPEDKGEATQIMSSSGVIDCFFLSADERYLLTLEADSYLRRYSMSGEMLGSSYLRTNISSGSGVLLQYMDDDMICLRLNNDLCVISCEDWELMESVSGCIGYSAPDNRYIILTFSDSRQRLGYFPRRSVTEMVGYANEILDGWDLPSDVKRRYGID